MSFLNHISLNYVYNDVYVRYTCHCITLIIYVFYTCKNDVCSFTLNLNSFFYKSVRIVMSRDYDNIRDCLDSYEV